LNFEVFIANRIVSKTKGNFSRPIVRLSIISVALGLSVMIISVAIVTGFQQQIRDKVIGFGSHIIITGFQENSSYEPSPVSMKQPLYISPSSITGIRHIQIFATKAGIIKTEDQIEGIIFKGIGSDYDWSFFKEKTAEGRVFSVSDTATTDDVIISKNLASRLKLKTGDPLRMYFIIPDEMQPRGRKFNISGIYETGLDEFDRMYVIGDINHIRSLNKWEKDQAGGFEILIDDFNQIDKIGRQVYSRIGYDLDAKTIRQMQPQIFEWLSLQDMNVVVIIIVMLLVSAITMISTLLILILEKTNMIGVLKAFGSTNRSVRKIFLYNAVYIIARGMAWGNAIALALCIIQLKTGILKLNQESYYIPVVPVNLQIPHLLLINLGTVMICTLMLIIPTYIVTRITPVKAIRIS
jgi:lipoprotein-releasing system permease protein